MVRLSRHRLLCVIALSAMTFTACSSAVRSTPEARPALECIVGPPPQTVADSATIVLTSPIDLANVSHATTWGERFTFGLLAEVTDVRDCQGRPLTTRAGPYRPRAVRQSTIALDPVVSGDSPRLIIRSVTDATARDLIDAGADLVLTETPALAAYGASRRDASLVRLGWDRTWVAATALPGGMGINPSSTLRADLARDVVPAEARPADDSSWPSAGACARPAEGTPPPAVKTARIVYPRSELVAQAIAERLVALIGGGAVAAGLAPNAFASALRGGTDLAYVFPVERTSRADCQRISDLAAGIPWLSGTPGRPGTVTPLIDTRLLSVVRHDRLRLVLTRDSTIVISTRQP